MNIKIRSFLANTLFGFIVFLPFYIIVEIAIAIEKEAKLIIPKNLELTGFPLLTGVIILWLIGKVITSERAKKYIDKLHTWLFSKPAIGAPYRFTHSIFNLFSGENSIFREVVLVKVEDGQEELGFITNRLTNDNKSWVFVPSVPIPISGRLTLVDEDRIKYLELTPREAIKVIMTFGHGLEDGTLKIKK